MNDMEHLLAGLRAVGERTRLRILFLLSHGELTIKELTVILNQSQPRVSRHVKLMAEADMVERYREGSWVFLRLAESGRPKALARMIVDLIPGDDEAVRQDMERLEQVRLLRSRKAAQYFDAIAEDWDQIRSLQVAETVVEDSMRNIAGTERVSVYLDIGTGTGRVLELFAPMADQAIGIDASHEMLAIARARLEKTSLRHAQVRHADLYSLPLASGSVDLVTIHQVLHFLDNPEMALAEASRVLQPGGRLMIVDFAPHEQEFLRETQAHRHLGIKNDTMSRWAMDCGLVITHYESLAPDMDTDGGLTVSLWLAEKPFDDPGHYELSGRKSTVT